jgi:hypothetical protein
LARYCTFDDTGPVCDELLFFGKFRIGELGNYVGYDIHLPQYAKEFALNIGEDVLINDSL